MKPTVQPETRVKPSIHAPTKTPASTSSVPGSTGRIAPATPATISEIASSHHAGLADTSVTASIIAIAPSGERRPQSA